MRVLLQRFGPKATCVRGTKVGDPERTRTADLCLDRAVYSNPRLNRGIDMSEWITNYAALWTVATVLLGFHIAALAWRMRRELDMQADGKTTWLTLTDWIMITSLLTLVVGVFILPILTSGNVSFEVVGVLFGLAVLMFSMTPIVLAGHYNLLKGPRGPEMRPHRTTQEWWAFVLTILVVVVYLLLVLKFVESPEWPFTIEIQETSGIQEISERPAPVSAPPIDCDQLNSERMKMAWDIVKNNQFSTMYSSEQAMEEVQKVAQGLRPSSEDERCP